MHAKAAGQVHTIDTETLGRASMLLGAGRVHLDSEIDRGVGVTVQARIGAVVDRSSPLATIHYNDAALADESEQLITSAYSINAAPAPKSSLIKFVLQ